MFKAVTSRLTYANVAATLALFLALSGGAAYAASHYLITKTSQIKPSVLAQLKGKAGANGGAGAAGAPGPAGPAGPGGAKGETGAAGAPGKEGAPGTNGTDGESVTGAAIAAGKECGAGVTGVKYTLKGTSTNVCNGKEGPPGPTCNAAGECVLPSNATETGTWAFGGHGGGVDFAAISYPLKITFALDGAHVKFLKTGEEGKLGECSDAAETTKGTSEHPLAAPGFLCIYASATEGVEEEPSILEFLSPQVGATMQFSTNASEYFGFGSWALTAP